jgi:hypothetical protein
MTRRAVEQLNPAPEVAAETHPYDGAGMLIAFTGNLAVYMRLSAPGEFFTDIGAKRPATDDQARAAFGEEAFARWRHEAKVAAENERIEAAIRATLEPKQSAEPEDLKAKARRLVREQQRKVQAAADKQLTSWLDQEPPAPAPGSLP